VACSVDLDGDERAGGDEVVDVDLEHPNLDPVSAAGPAPGSGDVDRLESALRLLPLK
jgi:hypothetical protein